MNTSPNFHFGSALFFTALYVTLLAPTPGLAQTGAPIDWSGIASRIETDGSLGPRQSLTPAGTTYTIGEDLGTRAGSNLFHSFLFFDLGSGDTARFTAHDPTDVVVSRITGDDPSYLNGKIHSPIAGADFYFLNPSGVFFGPNATLDIRGAAHVSTAQDQGFANGMQLVISPAGSNPPLLEMAALESFGFLGAPIRLDGTAVYFGNITAVNKVDGEVSLRGGDIEIDDGGGFIGVDRDISLVGSGTVLFNGHDNSGYGAAIHLANNSGGSGSVRIRGRRVEFTDAAWIATGSLQATCAGPGSCGGDISINASEEILFHGTAADEGDVVPLGLVEKVFGPGFSLPLSPGVGSVDLITLNLDSAAGAGSIDLNAPLLRILDGADVTTVTGELSDTSVGQGRISLTASDLLEISDLGGDGVGSRVQTQSVTLLGAAGSIEVDAGTVELRDGGTLAANTAGSAPGGDLNVVASQLVSISGRDLSGGSGGAPQPSTLQAAQIDSTSTGDGGSITVHAPRITLSDGGEILALSKSLNAGAGAIDLTADTVHLSGASEVSVFAVKGPPVPPDLGPGDPSPPGAVDGNISVAASDYLLLEGESRIEASVDEGLGGSISIGGIGQGAEAIVLSGNSSILAQARSTGAGAKAARSPLAALSARGGDIAINAHSVLVCPGCAINADGPTSSSGGSVVINNPETAIESQVVPPQVAYLDASAQLLAECGRQIGGGRFTVAHWPGLSDSSDEPLLQLAPNATAGEKVFAPYDTQALEARAAGQRLQAAQAEANAARIALTLGEDRGAASALSRAREELAQAQPSPSDEAALRIHLAESDAALARRDAPQRAAHLLAAHADLLRAFDLAQQSADQRAAAQALGQLGALYAEDSGRDREATALTHRALQLAEDERAADLLARFYAQLGALEWKQGQQTAALDAYRRAVRLLEETRPEARGDSAQADAVFRQSVEPVYLALVDRLLQSSGTGTAPAASSVPLLNEARRVVEQWKAAELRNYFRDSCAAELAATARSVESLDPHAAVIYPIALPDRLELLISRASGISRVTVPLSQTELEAEIALFRSLLTKRVTYDYEASAQKLHQWLVDPYLPLLEEESIETLVFVPSGALRTIPMAALHDGQRFLVERFALALTPSLDLLAPKPLQPGQANLLIAGVSEAVQGYPELPGVAREVAAIEALYGGTVLLDADFDPTHFESALRNQRPGIVHLASHAEITGDPDTSFVLTHDGQLSMEELAALVRSGRYGDDALELLMLSACETAVGDERAALGLAGVSIRAGARSAMGSLWSVSDQAAFRLVAGFYEALNTPGTSKARALQRAQKTLLANQRFQHPYYWSSFLVMNNWL